MTTALSVIILAHNESLLLGPTIRSAREAIAATEHQFGEIELILGVDSPNESMRDYLSDHNPGIERVLYYEFGDSGLTRNALVDECSGTHVAFLDGDDLFSENWLLRGMQTMLTNEEKNCIIHPEINWIFDGDDHVFFNTSMEDVIFSPYFFYFGNHYDTLCIAPKTCYLTNRFHSKKSQTLRIGYEDWTWNMDTITNGWSHLVAKDTIIFKRRRENSVSSIEKSARSAPRMSGLHIVDRMRSIQTAINK
jgi:glycosyltransferase involved in cell wall biosynthesis